mmetsp:Transcript_18203/g.27840  ORF Transcript_18203/g.27840 Transcript_18203/m.27840 type:complete len:298 (+) Transcript_18203:135-1028(+)
MSNPLLEPMEMNHGMTEDPCSDLEDNSQFFCEVFIKGNLTHNCAKTIWGIVGTEHCPRTCRGCGSSAVSKKLPTPNTFQVTTLQNIIPVEPLSNYTQIETYGILHNKTNISAQFIASLNQTNPSLQSKRGVIPTNIPSAFDLQTSIVMFCSFFVGILSTLLAISIAKKVSSKRHISLAEKAQTEKSLESFHIEEGSETFYNNESDPAEVNGKSLRIRSLLENLKKHGSAETITVGGLDGMQVIDVLYHTSEEESNECDEENGLVVDFSDDKSYEVSLGCSTSTHDFGINNKELSLNI